MRIVWVIALCAILLTGCSSSRSGDRESPGLDASARTIASSAGLVVTGRAQSKEYVVPDAPDDAFWGGIDSALAVSGTKLASYRGQTLTLSTYPIESDASGTPQSYTVVHQSDRVIGAYVALEGELGGPHGLSIVGR